MPTHKGKPLGLNDILEDAYGRLRIRPIDFDEYSMEEYLLTAAGANKTERLRLENEWVHFQFMGYYILASQGMITKSDQRKPIDQIIPNIYAPQKSKGSLKEQHEAKRAAAIKRTQELNKRVKIGQLQNRGRLRGRSGQSAQPGKASG